MQDELLEHLRGRVGDPDHDRQPEVLGEDLRQVGVVEGADFDK